MLKKSLEITVPVYNEEEELEVNIKKLYGYCQKNLIDYHWHITIADNASVDQTPFIAQKLNDFSPLIRYLRLAKKGRGRAIKKAWGASGADICMYMDVDLSTDLGHIHSLVRSLEKSPISIGSRLLSQSEVVGRTLKREFISRAYNFIVFILFQVRFSDAQCGFKGVTKKIVKDILPLVLDNDWFFDSELLILCEKTGYKISEIPVVWRDNPGSTVRILPTALGDLKGLFRLFTTRPWKNKNQAN